MGRMMGGRTMERNAESFPSANHLQMNRTVFSLDFTVFSLNFIASIILPIGMFHPDFCNA